MAGAIGDYVPTFLGMIISHDKDPYKNQSGFLGSCNVAGFNVFLIFAHVDTMVANNPLNNREIHPVISPAISWVKLDIGGRNP